MSAVPVALRETCRVVAGAVPLWPWHRARLAAGGCAEETLALVDEAVAAAAGGAGGEGSSRMRLSVTVGADGTIETAVSRRLSSLDVPGGPVPVLVRVDVPAELPPGAAKPADRAPWDAAQRAAGAAGGHQAVIVGPDGLVIDGGSATVWAVLGGVARTPPSPPAVAGVARALLLEKAPGLGVEVEVGPLSAEELDSASEVFFTNAFGGAVAARGRGGEVLRAFDGALRAVWG
ncbi:MAG: aminotransferase class IV [Coriobacteriia bacterium]